jgi:single-stranded-DNA-specific exonuclease
VTVTLPSPDPSVRQTRRWRVRPAPDPAEVARLAEALRLPAPLCALLAVRGLADPEAAKRFLRPRLEHLSAPQALTTMPEAVARLARAVRGRERVLVHGDYDVDGISSTTLMVRVLRALGGDAVPFIPHRLTDGYDLSDAGVREAQRVGARVVLTCDCGTSASPAVAALQAAGIDVIVSDHHLPGGPLPSCVAVLNPRRPDADPESGGRDLVAAGVAFQLARALAAELGADPRLVLQHLDLVALATVADVGALRGDNRVLVRAGLKLMRETRNVGLQALLEAAGLDDGALTAGRVGFTLAPRLNAAGRLGHALRGVELLLADDPGEARAIARELEELNRRRQQMDRDTLAEALAMAAMRPADASWGLVLAAEGWHAGVIGIVASRVVEQLHRPTVLVALDGDSGKGSGRSIPAFDLHAGLGECRDLLARFGGHRAAAGVTVARDRVAEFTARFNAVAKARLTPDDLVPTLQADLLLPLAEVTDDFERLLRHVEPFGMGNPGPVFVADDVTLATTPRVMKQEHVRFDVAEGGRELPVVGWRLAAAAEGLRAGDRVRLAYQVERDTYRGADRLQLKLVDVVRAA